MCKHKCEGDVRRVTLLALPVTEGSDWRGRPALDVVFFREFFRESIGSCLTVFFVAEREFEEMGPECIF